MANEFSGKVVVVSGGSRGIGRAIAAAFAGEGAQTVLAASNPANLAEGAKAVAAAGGPAGRGDRFRAFGKVCRIGRRQHRLRALTREGRGDGAADTAAAAADHHDLAAEFVCHRLLPRIFRAPLYAARARPASGAPPH